jgi:hypothetical protein
MIFVCSIAWGDVATWFSGIVTFGALAFAYYQLHSDRRITREDEARSQAENISAWVEDEVGLKAQVALLNASTSPVYKVIAKLVRAGSDLSSEIDMSMLEFVAFITVLPPGKFRAIVSSDYHGMQFRPAIEIAFTDSKGKHWVRDGNGVLHELPKVPTKYYGVGEPMEWNLPQLWDKLE